MEDKIKEILNELGIRINVKGYWFWITAIEYKNEKKEASMADVYEKVAEIHNTVPSRVERALRHAYDRIRKNVEQYFDIKYKINNSTFLLLILEEIRKRKVENV